MKINLIFTRLLLAAVLACSVSGPRAQTPDGSNDDSAAQETGTIIPEGDSPEGESSVTDQSSATPFSAAVNANWDKWSGGQDTVVRADLVPKLADPAYTGDNAAALAALTFYLRKDRSHIPVSKQDAASLTDPTTMAAYNEMSAKLKTMSRAVFSSGGPDFEKMQQHPATDCYFYSGTGWIAKYRPDVIKKAIKTLGEKGYRVTFPSGEDAIVAAPTDAEIAYNDSPMTLQSGIWMSILAKAEGVLEGQKNEKRAAIADPVLRVDVGGGPEAIVKRWTGKKPVNYRLGEEGDIKAVRKALVKMAENNLMAEVFARKPKGKIAGNHCYAVMDFDAGTDTVTVWNPWGNDFTPKGPDGPDFGYARRHGVFKIPLSEFMRCFSFLSIEKA
ncbi:MAG: hypothetical protein WCS77_04305 [Elusimicrobiaceae bacterium]